MNRGKSHRAAADISKLATLVNNIIFCCGCHMNCADRLFVRPAARPRNAGNRNGEMRGCNVKSVLRHGAHHRFADRAMLLQQIGVHPQYLALGAV